jgi:hypothetical protein
VFHGAVIIGVAIVKDRLCDLISIAVGIAVLMPFKQRIEHAIDRYFAGDAGKNPVDSRWYL